MVNGESLIVNRRWSFITGHSLFTGVSVICLSSVIFFSSCKKGKPDISNIVVDLTVKRFEQDLFSIDTSHKAQEIQNLMELYGDFFSLYFQGYSGYWQMRNDSSSWKDSLVAYIRDPVLRSLYDSVEKRFSDFTLYETELTASFRYYKFYFPKAIIPDVITLINGPGHGAFTYGDSILCIALEDYMSPQFSFYRYLDIPQYLLRRFKPEYITSNCIQVYTTHHFPYDENGKKLLDAMIYNGKLTYLKSLVMPDAPDSVVTGFREKDLEWCEGNEAQIWKFFISKDLLYTDDPLEYLKYVNNGPTTSGMPPEAPGNMGSWVGWRIVSAYMKRHKEVSLQQLMQEEDAQKILAESKYKP